MRGGHTSAKCRLCAKAYAKRWDAQKSSWQLALNCLFRGSAHCAPCPPTQLIARRQTTYSAAMPSARPDQLWVADIAYVPTLAGFLFLAVVMECSAAAS
jgi:transposase InsO family protein